MFRLYSSNGIGNVYNCTYSKQVDITDKQSLIEAVSHDYVSVLYRDNHRDCNSFIESNCIIMDCDNTHSDNPSKWLNVSDVQTAFTDVAFAVHYSRNHMREKDGRTARPKFHILFRYDKYVQSYTKFILFILWHSRDMPSCFIEPDFADIAGYFRLV